MLGWLLLKRTLKYISQLDLLLQLSSDHLKAYAYRPRASFSLCNCYVAGLLFYRLQRVQQEKS